MKNYCTQCNVTVQDKTDMKIITVSTIALEVENCSCYSIIKLYNYYSELS